MAPEGVPSDGVGSAVGTVPGSGGAGEEGLEAGEKYFELHAASQGLEAANRLAEGVKTELDRKRIAFQSKKDDLMRELKQVLADKAEAEKQVDEDVARLQKEIKVFKFMKYRDGYNDRAQSKSLGAFAQPRNGGSLAP